MGEWVNVACEETEEPIEIQAESDGTILLSSIIAQFPGTTGLKFRNVETQKMRGVRVDQNVMYPPTEQGWQDFTYICVRPEIPKKDERKRKTNSELDTVSKNVKWNDSEDPMDLVILGIPWKCTEDELRKYFTSYGEVEFVDIKMKANGESKGFGFIRFVEKESESKVLLQKHLIGGRWCEVKVPDSKDGKKQDHKSSCKIFVGRLTESITKEDLETHFSEFGSVTDVYIPQPFRRFAFVAFTDVQVAQSLLGKEHNIKGTTISIGEAVAKDDKNKKGGAGDYYGGANYNKFVEMAARYGNPAMGFTGFPGSGGAAGSDYSSGRSGGEYRSRGTDVRGWGVYRDSK